MLPIFDFNVTYMPWDDTSVFAEAGRTTTNSFDFAGDTIDYTSVQIGASQKFMQKFTFTATGGYSEAQYQQSIQIAPGVSSTRDDDYFYGKANVRWDPNDWLNVQATYQWSRNISTVGSTTFTDNQIDLQSSVKF